MKKIILFIFFLSLTIATMAQNGKVRGRVLDKNTNEAVAFANVVIEGTAVGSVTDLDGRFTFTGLKPGFIRLQASFVGYKKTLSAEFQVTNAKEMYLEILMEQTGTELQEVTITVSPFMKAIEAPISMQRIGLSDIENNPGSNRDVSKVIQSFPGVGSLGNARNDILIRGGGPAENAYYLDDVEIPTINHFSTQGASGGAVGIINADFLQSVDFYAASFPAKFNNALSSGFDFKFTEGNKEKQRVRASLGASEMSLTMDGPITDNSSYIFSIRRSYLQLLFKAIGLPFLPTFNDYQLKYKINFNSKNELRIISLGALDQFALNKGITNPTESQDYILSYLPVNEQWSYVIGGVYKHFSKNSIQTVVLSRNMLNNVSYKYPENDESQAKSFDYLSQEIENKLRLEHSFTRSGYKTTFSVNAEYAKYSNETKQKVVVGNQVLDLNYQSNLSFLKYGASAQINKEYFKERLLLTLGARLDGNNYASSMNNPLKQFSPRFSARYRLLPKLSVMFNTGIYNRLPAYTSLGYRDSQGNLVNQENNIKYISSTHFVGGFQYDFSDNILITAEAFHKTYSNYPFSLKDSLSLANLGADYGSIGAEEINSTGEGRAYGIELMNRYRINKKLNFIFSYTWFKSEFKDKFGKYAPSSWDSRHLLTITSSMYLKNNWTIGAKWRYVGALPYTPYDMELSSVKNYWDTQGKPFQDLDNVNSERLSPFHQLDIRIDKKYFFEKWTLMLYFDVQNAYNFKSESQDYVVRVKDANGNYLTTDNGTKYVLKTIPSTSGLVLPTFGVMVEF